MVSERSDMASASGFNIVNAFSVIALERLTILLSNNFVYIPLLTQAICQFDQKKYVYIKNLALTLA